MVTTPSDLKNELKFNGSTIKTREEVLGALAKYKVHLDIIFR